MKTTPPRIAVFAGNLNHPEGLAFDRAGVLWAGGEAGQIYRITPDGKDVKEVANTGGFNLGLAFSPEGWLAVCDGKNNCIWRYDPEGNRLKKWAHQSGGRPLGGMNYPVFDRLGWLFASENGRWGKREGVVHRFAPNGEGEPWAGRLYFANGLALNAEEDALFVVESTRDDVVRIPIRPASKAGKAEVFVDGVSHVPDGLAFDENGWLYVCCYGDNRIWKVSPHGKKQLLVDDPTSVFLNRTTNLAFGGSKQTTLYVANLGGYHIASIPLKVRGAQLAGVIGGGPK